MGATENATTLSGGWSPYRPLTAEDKAVFDQAMQGLVGVGYVPSQVSTQVVAGTNYRYQCTATVVSASPSSWQAIVQIYQPLPGQGKPHVTDITRI